MSQIHDRLDKAVMDDLKHLVSMKEWDTGFLPYLNEVEHSVIQLLKREDLSEKDTAICRGCCKQIKTLRELRSGLHITK